MSGGKHERRHSGEAITANRLISLQGDGRGGSWDADLDRLDREDIFWGCCIVGFVEVVSIVQCMTWTRVSALTKSTYSNWTWLVFPSVYDLQSVCLFKSVFCTFV